MLCGGAISHAPLEKASLADFDLLYRSNLRGHYALIQATLPLLRQQKGQIVFINSSAGLRSPATVGQLFRQRNTPSGRLPTFCATR